MKEKIGDYFYETHLLSDRNGDSIENIAYKETRRGIWKCSEIVNEHGRKIDDRWELIRKSSEDRGELKELYDVFHPEPLSNITVEVVDADTRD